MYQLWQALGIPPYSGSLSEWPADAVEDFLAIRAALSRAEKGTPGMDAARRLEERVKREMGLAP